FSSRRRHTGFSRDWSSDVCSSDLVLKTNANQSYAADGRGQALFAALCREADVPMQDFVTRTDLPCGGTIGPISAARIGMRTVDRSEERRGGTVWRSQCMQAELELL